MVSTAPAKPHITLTGKAIWRCADAYLDRSGRSPKQAYDRWLMASLSDAATVANLCPPAAPATKKLGRPRKEVMPMGWYADAQAKKDAQADRVADSDPVAKGATKATAPATGFPVSPTATPKKAELAKLRKIASSVPEPQLRQSGTALPKTGGKPITIKAAPRAAAVEQPTYSASMVRQMPGMTARREYSPPADLVRNQQRASAHQPPLASISTSDRN